MADAAYQPKVYRKQGADELVIASGGTITVESGGTIAVEDGANVTLEANVDFGDAELLRFGDSDDVTMQWDATNFLISAAADDSVIEFGDSAATQKSFDVKIYGDAANGADYLLWDASASTLDFVGAAQIDMSSTTPASHPINMESLTLPASSNAIRGTNVVPTRVSGWTCFTGTLSGVSAYMDYREMHTAGADIVYGEGLFGFMDSGASCSTILSLQAITTVNSGATLTTAGGSPLSGAYAAQFKMLFDGATINSGAISAVACFLYQSNVTVISGEQTSILQLSIDSGLLQNIFHINCGAAALSTYFVNFSTETSPVLNWGADNQPNAASADKGLRCLVGAVEYWIPLYVNT